ncbi:CrcB family protein [Filobacillus milosensis]|uniref:Fluoride-specific ion channel FluC n=1 Tax=Filobacillus milosensis TaxID=94137 RepID=A0A4Y8IHU4_9BACI|nr:CrcB family protein [Filobacillus milosensis]TFB14273.1 CrcB family protein [Filobacillus milosensis]
MKYKFKEWAYIGTGGALGSLLRASITQLFTTTTFPIATLLVNLLGSLLLGGITAYLYGRSNQSLHLFFGIGFCGSFTTMSMFAADATILLEQGQTTMFLWYNLLSVICGILLAILGFILIKNILEKRGTQ